MQRIFDRPLRMQYLGAGVRHIAHWQTSICRVMAPLLAILLSDSSALQAQNIRVDVVLRQFVATVTDSQGKLVTSLKPEDFIVELGGIRQQITGVAQGTDVPVTVGLLLDNSGSMTGIFPAVVEAASSFVSRLRPGDESFLLTFGNEVRLLQDLTQNKDR